MQDACPCREYDIKMMYVDSLQTIVDRINSNIERARALALSPLTGDIVDAVLTTLPRTYIDDSAQYDMYIDRMTCKLATAGHCETCKIGMIVQSTGVAPDDMDPAIMQTLLDNYTCEKIDHGVECVPPAPIPVIPAKPDACTNNPRTCQCPICVALMAGN